jgi:hypothetical protein
MKQPLRKRDFLNGNRTKGTMIVAPIVEYGSRRAVEVVASTADRVTDLEAALDEALAETFPASDPIACTPKSVAELRILGRVSE